MSKSKFNCSQAVLVVALETILQSMENHLSDFTAFRPKYVLGWINDRRSELNDAAALPDEEARRAQSSILRVQLAEQNSVCCALWQKLARYINGAYTANIVDIQLLAAGQAKYKNAANENWADGKSMLTSAKAFILNNLATLTADDNMNPGFEAEFNTAADEFERLLRKYEDSKEAVLLATQTKIAALNEVYEKITLMTLDGQEIYKTDEALRTQFVFANVVDRISGPGLAGVRGTISDGTTLLPISGAVVTISLASNPASTYTAVTNPDGKYLINCPSGDYNLSVVAVNYQPSAIKQIKVEVGTVSAADEQLTAV